MLYDIFMLSLTTSIYQVNHFIWQKKWSKLIFLDTVYGVVPLYGVVSNESVLTAKVQRWLKTFNMQMQLTQFSCWLYFSWPARGGVEVFFGSWIKISQPSLPVINNHSLRAIPAMHETNALTLIHGFKKTYKFTCGGVRTDPKNKAVLFKRYEKRLGRLLVLGFR